MTQTEILSLLAEVIDFLDNQADAEIDADGKLVGNPAILLMSACEDAYSKIESKGVANDISGE